MSSTEIAAELYTRMGARDIDGVLELLSDDVEWVNEPKDIHVHGKDELRALWKRQMGAAKVEIVPVKITKTSKGALVEIREKVWSQQDELLFDGPVGHDYTIKGESVMRCDIIDV